MSETNKQDSLHEAAKANPYAGTPTLTLKGVCEKLGVHRNTLARWIKAGSFPEGRKLHALDVHRHWYAHEIDDWRAVQLNPNNSEEG